VNDNQETVLRNLAAWNETLDVLIQHLAAAENSGSRESIFLLIIQGFGLFDGPDSVLMQECAPAMDVMKARIDSGRLADALRQALLFRKQLEEVSSLVQTKPLPDVPPPEDRQHRPVADRPLQ
jgi:hypothetical protein